MKRALLTLSVVALFLIPAFAFAADPAVDYANADAVFTGYPTEIWSDDEGVATYALFDISSIWKGRSLMEDGTIQVYNLMASGRCDTHFEMNQEYVVYGTFDNNGLHVSVCTGFKPLQEADEDIAYFGSLNGDVATPFWDVSANHPHARAIAYLHDEGIVQGYKDGAYRAENFISRAEFIKIVVESLRDDLVYTLNGQNVSAIDYCLENFGWMPTDVWAEAWFAPYICAAAEANIAKGYPDGTFRPNENIIFPEAAKIVANAIIAPEMHYFEERQYEPWYAVYIDALEERSAIPRSIDVIEHRITRGEMAEIIWRLKAGITTEPSRDF